MRAGTREGAAARSARPARPRLASLAGAAIVLAHAVGFAALGARCRGTELAVSVEGPPAAAVLALDAWLPDALADRITVTDTAGPGLSRRRWTVRYRGGIERSVGAVQLVGPFQDPRAARCVGRVVVGQRLLDDGHAGPGTIAAAVRRLLDAELRGQDVLAAGTLVRIDRFALRWAELGRHPEDRALVGQAPHGYVRASATVVFERVIARVVVAAIPVPAPGELRFRIAARAELAFDSRALQWLSDRLGGDRLASRLAQGQIDDAIATALAPLPPYPLPGGQALRFTYCDEPPEITDGGYAALPLGVALGRARDPRILPPRFGPGPRRAPAPSTRLALDLDLDAVNALLYELWRGGVLDRQLADAGLDRRFNADPTVTALLSVRLSALTLALPPVITAAPGGLRLSAEARLGLHDGQAATRGRVWGGLAFRISPAAVQPVAVELAALELSCERDDGAALAPRPGAVTLVPCYGDLVSALRGRAAAFHGALTTRFTQLLSDLVVGRFAARDLAADLAIRGAVPSVIEAANNATLHLELEAAVVAPR